MPVRRRTCTAKCPVGESTADGPRRLDGQWSVAEAGGQPRAGDDCRGCADEHEGAVGEPSAEAAVGEREHGTAEAADQDHQGEAHQHVRPAEEAQGRTEHPGESYVAEPPGVEQPPEDPEPPADDQPAEPRAVERVEVVVEQRSHWDQHSEQAVRRMDDPRGQQGRAPVDDQQHHSDRHQRHQIDQGARPAQDQPEEPPDHRRPRSELEAQVWELGDVAVELLRWGWRQRPSERLAVLLDLTLALRLRLDPFAGDQLGVSIGLLGVPLGRLAGILRVPRWLRLGQPRDQPRREPAKNRAGDRTHQGSLQVGDLRPDPGVGDRQPRHVVRLWESQPPSETFCTARRASSAWPASRTRSTGTGSPVIRSTCSTAWCANRSSPLTNGRPESIAACANGVSHGS